MLRFCHRSERFLDFLRGAGDGLPRAFDILARPFGGFTRRQREDRGTENKRLFHLGNPQFVT